MPFIAPVTAYPGEFEMEAMAAGAIEGVTAVAVTLTYEPAWEPAMIAAE